MAKRKSASPWFFKYAKAQLRRIWGWAPERKEVKKRAGGLLGPWNCEQCLMTGLSKGQYQIDHIESVECLGEWDGWENYINRLFCPASGLQLLCLICHEGKTVADNATRRKARKPGKASK